MRVPAMHPTLRLPYLLLIVCCLLLMAAAPAHAWDATAHRLSAYLAWDTMNAAARQQWSEVLQAHPRFQQDFIDAMPSDIRHQSSHAQARWQFGQAAVWPDIARGFSGDELERFHHANWHWLEGAWVRGEANLQGNIYLDTQPLPDIAGASNDSIRHEEQATNVITALEYAHWQLQQSTEAGEQAVALCWLLHLIGDIHQPLHTGGLVSAELFPRGDRGGNDVAISGNANGHNLHAIWDAALRGEPFGQKLDELARLAGNRQFDTSYRPEHWLYTSRRILHSDVYPDSILNNVRSSENTDNQLGSTRLSQAYLKNMQDLASIRVAQTGLRITATLKALEAAP